MNDPHPELVAWHEPGAISRRVLAPIGAAIQLDDARRLGLRTTTALGRAFNAADRRHIAPRRRFFEEHRDGAGRIAMQDGFALDESRTLPHLDALLAAGEELIEQFAGGRYEFTKPYLQDISPESAMDTHPALLDFVTSPEVVWTAAPAFGYVPLLPATLPEGVRLMESRTDFDPQADGPWRGSQLYHLDYHSSPTVYVIVAVRDIDPDDGPLHFLGKAASQRVADAIGYGRRGVPYRLTDEVVYQHVDPGGGAHVRCEGRDRALPRVERVHALRQPQARQAPLPVPVLVHARRCATTSWSSGARGGSTRRGPMTRRCAGSC